METDYVFSTIRWLSIKWFQTYMLKQINIHRFSYWRCHIGPNIFVVFGIPINYLFWYYSIESWMMKNIKHSLNSNIITWLIKLRKACLTNRMEKSNDQWNFYYKMTALRSLFVLRFGRILWSRNRFKTPIFLQRSLLLQCNFS